DDPTGLAHLAGIDLGPSGSRLGPLVFNASVDGDQDRLVVDVGMMADGAELWVRGTLGALAENLTMDVAYGVAHPNFPDLAQALAWRGLATGAQVLDGPVSLRGTAAGTLLNLQVGVTGALAGADVGVVGTMAWSDRVAYSLQASITHDHAAVVLAGFGMGPGDDPDFGPLQVRGALDGDGQQLAISGLQAAIGPSEFTGTANLGFGSDLFRMGATVAATELDLAAFFPGIAGPAATDDGDIRRNWSVEPIDFSIVEAANLDLNLTAETLDGFGLAFTDASLSVRTANGVLAVDDFHGNGLGGAVAVALTVTNGAVPSLEGTLDLAAADLSMLPGFGWDLGVTSGTVNAHFDLKTVGASERELVANLEGSMSLEGSDGMLEGFSLANFNGRFAEIKDVAELNALMQPAMRSGQTPFVTLRAEAAMRQGVIEFDELAADLPFGTVETTGEIDLPRRRANFDLEVLLTEFPDAPPFGMSLAGPWDAPRRSNDTEALLAYVASRPPLVEIIPPTPEPVIAPPVVPVVAPTPIVQPVVQPDPTPTPTPTPAPAPIAEAVVPPTPVIQPVTAPEPGQNPAGTPDAIVAPALTPAADAPPAPLPGAAPAPQPAPAPAPAPPPVVEAPPVIVADPVVEAAPVVEAVPEPVLEPVLEPPVELVPEPDPEPAPDPAPEIQPGGLAGPDAPAAPDAPETPVVEGAEPADGGAPAGELTPAQQLQQFLEGIAGGD
ncbi:MAG: AsmA family protein, partial [Alphaproteobacteria bacterium]|nr:AsmA family protein [Alphaproteobacteria bacterium]